MKQLLVAYQEDHAGYNMAKFLSEGMQKNGDIHCGEFFDVLIIDSPAISADWLGGKYNYDGFVFLSRHAAESGVLALTCHSTGNFSEAKFGGKDRQVAIPHPNLQKAYLRKLYENKEQYSDFQITIEATHHGPTDIDKPVLFVEIGTTEKQWTDVPLCESVAKIVQKVMETKLTSSPTAICFGGTHYPEKFTNEILAGDHSLGTVVPRHAIDSLDEELFSHILQRNDGATVALLDRNGLGPHKQKILDLLKKTNLEVIKI